jgi:o-succinylbenzoate---CoA ligase
MSEPAREAIIAGGRTLTFGELEAPVVKAMRALEPVIAAPPVSGRHALVAEPSVPALVTIYALLELGATIVPLSPRLTAPERDRRIALAFGGPPAPAGSRPLALVFTAGTTGAPRAAALSAAAFRASAEASAANLGWRADDRWLVCMPLDHVGGLGIVTRSLLARRPLVLVPRFEAREVLDTIRGERATLLSLVPAMLDRLLALAPRPDELRTLRAVLVGGAHASAALMRRARAAGFPVLATYGLTETCSQVTTRRPEEVGDDEGDHNDDAGPPLPGVELRIVAGRIQVRGAMLFSGYVTPSGIEAPALEDGWFETGDAGRLDERGRLHVHGRTDEVIVTGGEKVHPLEVEDVLAAAGGVTAACVFGLEDPTWGAIVCAVLVAAGGAPPVDAALRAHLDAHLASWKRPRRIAWLDALPLTAAGKPDRASAARLAVPRLRDLL